MNTDRALSDFASRPNTTNSGKIVSTRPLALVYLFA